MMKKSKMVLAGLIVMAIAGGLFIWTSTCMAACPDNITAYWKMDKPKGGGGYKDEIGGNTGTSFGTVAAISGRVGNAVSFSGTATGINVPPDRTFAWYYNESFSVEFWVYPTAPVSGANPHVIIGQDDPTSSGSKNMIFWIGLVQDGGLGFQLTDDTGAGQYVGSGIGTGKITQNNWHHVVFQREANEDGTGTTRIYINGEKEGEFDTVTYKGRFGYSWSFLNLGYLKLDGVDGFYLIGALDEVALYDRALSEGEIDSHFAAGEAGEDYCGGEFPGSTPYPEKTISLWDLDQNLSDAVGENDGTGNPSPTLDADDGINGCHTFAGSSGIDVEASRTFGWYENDPFSIEFWVKMNGTVTGYAEVVIGRDDPVGLPTATNSLHWWIGIVPDGGIGYAMYDQTGAGAWRTAGSVPVHSTTAIGIMSFLSGIQPLVIMEQTSSISMERSKVLLVRLGIMLTPDSVMQPHPCQSAI
jgi:hypothetical protein